MLITETLHSWTDFEKIVKEELLYQTQMPTTGPFYYRGHPDASWRLETTLERYMGENQSVGGYYSDLLSIQSYIETFTDRNWNLPSRDDYDGIVERGEFLKIESVVSYMQYLRHYGYPSPLLDWTLSPFVAAYFAFRDISNRASSIAIYKFLMSSDLWAGPTTRNIFETAHIYPVSVASQKNKRHYLQQSVYTVCLRKENRRIWYASHEDPYVIGSEEDASIPGRYITKYVIPASERTTALHSLEFYNINAYSLMGTEESLLETLFLRAHNIREIERKMFPD